MWGLLLSELIALLFRPVLPCPDEEGNIPFEFESCQEYWDSAADSMRTKSFEVSVFWLILVANCLIGFILNYWGFGTASERLNKRVRDSSFFALMRQEVAYFDQRSVGRITSQLQDDAGRIQAFSGEPVRALLVALSAVATGLVLSFIVRFTFVVVFAKQYSSLT